MRKRLKKKLTKKLLLKKTMREAFRDAFVCGMRELIVKKVLDEFFEENILYQCVQCGNVSTYKPENYPSLCDNCEVRTPTDTTRKGNSRE